MSVGELAITPRISARRGLLLEGFLEFLKQPDVLDGDDRLVGEGFEQFDLRRGEGAYLVATRGQCSNEFVLMTKGNGQESAKSRRWNPLLESWLCARTSGTWSVPCSRIQRICGHQYFDLDVRNGYEDQNEPAKP